jgi:hypothetical protein
MATLQIFGYAASVLVLAAFCMTDVRELRLVAIGSNILFIIYSLLGHIYPVLVLHSLLFPINVVKLFRTAPKALRCAQCGSQCSPRKRFCADCGARLSADLADCHRMRGGAGAEQVE